MLRKSGRLRAGDLTCKGNPTKVSLAYIPFLAIYSSAHGQQNLWAITKRNTIRIGWCFLFGMPRAGWNSLPQPARISGRTAVGFRVGRPALRPPPFITGAFVCRAAGCGHPALRMSASNRSVGDGVPDVPSARRCRAGNGFPRRFAPRSKCPWGTPRNDRGEVYRHAERSHPCWDGSFLYLHITPRWSDAGARRAAPWAHSARGWSRRGRPGA